MHADDSWLAGLRHWDPAAYDLLVSRYEGTLYRYFLASHGNSQLAGEQSTDCFGELLRAIPKMNGGPEQLRPFIFTVARNVLRRHWRRQENNVSLDAAREVACVRASPDTTAEQREEIARFLEALNQLDRQTREVFILRFVEELSLAEVANIVGEPLGTVKSRVHRGKQHLRELLKTTDKP